MTKLYLILVTTRYYSAAMHFRDLTPAPLLKYDSENLECLPTARLRENRPNNLLRRMLRRVAMCLMAKSSMQFQMQSPPRPNHRNRLLTAASKQALERTRLVHSR